MVAAINRTASSPVTVYAGLGVDERDGIEFERLLQDDLALTVDRVRAQCTL